MTHTLPTIFGDMSDAEKGAILLADHDGGEIQAFLHGDVWEKKSNGFPYFNNRSYRVKPTPRVAASVVTSYAVFHGAEGTQYSTSVEQSHEIKTTFTLHDGVPVSGTVEVAS